MSDLAKRLLSAAALLPPLIALLVLGPPALFTAVSAALAALAALELSTMSIGEPFPRLKFLVPVSAALVAVAIALSTWIPWLPLAVLVASVPVSFAPFALSTADREGAVRAGAFALVGTVYCGALFGIAALTFSKGADGRWWILLLAAGAFLGDTLAYATGRLLGGPRLAPRISPKKTVSGAAGGAVGTMLAIAACKAILPLDLEWRDVALLGLPLSAACQIGDLLESFFKRGLGAKDSGNLIPGHGGLLDRCDALMLGAPVVYLYSFLR